MLKLLKVVAVAVVACVVVAVVDAVVSICENKQIHFLSWWVVWINTVSLHVSHDRFDLLVRA